MRAPRYAKDDDELKALAGQARQWACPHCGRRKTLNAHGALRGCAEDGPGKSTLRGRRFFCSNRGMRPGCGRTFSVLLATLLAGATVRTGRLWQFYRARCATGSVARAWAQLRGGFSVEAAYRWWHRWQAGQFRIRAWLHAQRAPPETGSLLDHLTAVCGPADPLAAYQLARQEPWPATRPPPST
jgi:hypothetical protein